MATAAAAAAVVVGGVVWQPWDNGPSRPPVAASAQQQVLRASDARTYTDRSTTVVRSASLKKAVVKVTLPPPPAGKVYEVWLQHPDGHMVRAGLIPDVSRARDGVLLEGDAATAIGAGITVEPAGGSRLTDDASRSRWSRSAEPARGRSAAAVSASGAGPARRPAPAS